jgi:3-(3-hydroxy-phenyl)propionate hydroxylase
MAAEDYDVAIVGLGPTGATAANLLGQLGLRTAVFEKDLDVFPRQRAIAADEDALRVWQNIGLLDTLMADMETDIKVHFRHGDKTFLSFDARHGKGQGVPGTVFFHQPSLEGALRAGIARFENVDIFVGESLVGVQQDAGGVDLTTVDAQGRQTSWRARYVIAADGGSSPTRKLLGIGLPGRHISEQWYDVQVRATKPRPQGAPLDFTFLADPRRPGVDCPCPGGLHRYEFLVRPDEDVNEIATHEGMARVLAERGVKLDPSDVYRHWAYTFHIRQAERWREGRVFLVGDAAHIMPPFAGQGVSSGVRDVANLCWKLYSVVGGEPDEGLLDSYETERRPNVMEHTKVSLRIGSIVMSRNRLVVAVRDAVGRVVMATPLLRDYIRAHPVKPEWRVGGPGALPARRVRRSAVGRLVKQPTVTSSAGGRYPLDDLLGPGWSWVGVAPAPAGVVAAGVPIVTVAQGGSVAASDLGEVYVDEQGLLLRQLRRHRAQGFLVRPDRFIYADDRYDLAALPSYVRAWPAAGVEGRRADGSSVPSRPVL